LFITTSMRKIKYQAIWSSLYILLGVLFGLLFIFGALLLEDLTVLFNSLAAIIVIYIGYKMRKQPYAEYNAQEIKLYSYLGTIRKRYTFQSPSAITIKSNRLYLNNEKLKINAWMVDKKDWQRMLDFYSDTNDVMLDELQDEL